MPRIELPGGNIEYVDQGSGEPVVLLHCSGSSSAQWRSLIGRLAARFRVLAPDLHGYGASETWNGPEVFSLAHEAAVVDALLAQVDRPAHLVGHSYGGAVALHVARTRAARLRSLTVIEPVALHLLRRGSNLDNLALREVSAVAEYAARALDADDRANGYGRFVDYWSGEGAWAAIPPEKRDALATQLPKIVLDFHALFHEPATLADFRSLDVPTLVMQGASTVRPTRRICKLLAATLPNARLKRIAGAGHMLTSSHRDEVEKIIVRRIEANALRLGGRDLVAPVRAAGRREAMAIRTIG